MVEANPQSGYDDCIYVVQERSRTRQGSQFKPTVSYRSEQRAHEVADHRSDRRTQTRVTCVGLKHE